MGIHTFGVLAAGPGTAKMMNGYYSIPTSSTSKISVELGGITGG